MSELDLRREPTADLAVWAEQAHQVHQIAKALAGTSFVPKSMQGRPDETTGAILAGREIGLSPMAALRSIDIIDGTPAMRALALRALVQAHGHDIEVAESTDTRAVVRGRRRGSTTWQSATWTIDRARKAGLAGKRNWTTNPAAMLVARATAEMCRLIAADAILGMPYASEELADGERPEDAEPVVAATRARRVMQRRALPAEPEPPGQPEPAAESVREGVAALPGTPAMTARTRGALFAAYRAAGISERADRLAHAERVLGRDVGSATELSETDAVQLIAHLALAHEEGGRDDGDDSPS